jgi:hypothetical protein
MTSTYRNGETFKSNYSYSLSDDEGRELMVPEIEVELVYDIDSVNDCIDITHVYVEARDGGHPVNLLNKDVAGVTAYTLGLDIKIHAESDDDFVGGIIRETEYECDRDYGRPLVARLESSARGR